MPFDYSQTDDPRDFSELIPHNTIATTQMRIRPGNAGPDGLYKRTARGDAEMLDCEFVVLDGPFAKRKFWDNFMLAGTTDGQKEMVLTNRGRLKKILESARGIKKGDTSEQNLALYRAEDKDFNNIIFVARIGVKKGEPKNDGSGTSWSDKNYLLAAITPDQKDWHPVEQPPPFNGGGATAPTGAAPAGSAPAGHAHYPAAVGTLMRKLRTVGMVSPSALEDEWQRRATAAAIEAARSVVTLGGPIPPATPVGRLNDTELGWVLAAMLFAWIRTRAEQAAAEELDTEQTIRMTGLDPEPWDAGAVAAILPELASTSFDWSQPITAWPKDTMVEFLLTAMRLIRKAMIARDLSDKGVSRQSNASTIARQANAAAGGPLMTPDEWNDEIGL